MSTAGIRAAMVAALVVAVPLGAQTTTQTVNYEVDAINKITTSGAVTLHITAADVTAGASATLSRTNATSTYAFTSNDNVSANGKTIEANLDTNMPTDVALKITLAAPGTGTSAGEKSLTTSQSALVNGITPTNAAASAITYKLEALVTAGPQSASSRTVTFTIIDTP